MLFRSRDGKSEKATFYNEDQIVDLENQVHFEDPQGQKFDAPLVRILLEEDEVLIKGPVRVEFYPEEEEETGTPAPAPAGSQAPPLAGFEKEGGGGAGAGTGESGGGGT